jgi:hypothetical protein
MPIVHQKQLASGLYIRIFDRYINADTSDNHSGDNDDPSRLEGYLDADWSDTGPLTTVNRTDVITVLDTNVICGVVRPDVSGTWEFRIRADDAGYIWVGSNAEPLEWNLSKDNAVGDAGGAHAAVNGDGSVTLTAGQLYAIKAMVGDRGGGDAFIIDFSGPAGSQWSAALSNTGRDGTGFYFHNPDAPNGYNLDS